MKMYYAIDFRKMKDLNINATKWMFCENIHFVQAISESGWCEKTRKELAEHHEISLSQCKKIVRELIECGLIKINKKWHLKTTQKWHEIGGIKKETVQEIGGIKKETVRGQKIDDRGIKKETVQPIRENLERVRENTRTSVSTKKFSFTLKKNSHYSKLSQDYKDKLFSKILLLDNAENYEDFILALESNEKYKYMDFSKVYMKWYKVSGDNGRKVKIQDEEWIEVIHKGKPIAINPNTYETKEGKFKQQSTQQVTKNRPSMELAGNLAKGARV